MEDHAKNLRNSDLSSALRSYTDPMRDLQYFPSAAERETTRQWDLIDAVRSAPKRNADNIQKAIRSHIEVLQAKIGEDEQLLVGVQSTFGTLLVHEVGFPNPYTVVLIGKTPHVNGCRSEYDSTHVSSPQNYH